MTDAMNNPEETDESATLDEAVCAVADRLLRAARDDPRLRSELRRLAAQVARTLDRFEQGEGVWSDEAGAAPPGEAVATEPGSCRSDEAAAPAPAEQPVDAMRPQDFAAALKLGQGLPESVEPANASAASAGDFRGEPLVDADLAAIEARCRLKAEAACWAAQRRTWLQGGANFHEAIEPWDKHYIARAKEMTDCFLWMCHQDGPEPPDIGLWKQVGACFETTAATLSLTRSLIEPDSTQHNLLEQALALLAEAHSALRVAVTRIGAAQDDPDQIKIHRWLRRTTNEQRIHIRRYMRADDPADPDETSDLSDRVEGLYQQWKADEEQRKRRRSNMNTVRYHADQLEEGRSINPERDWQRIAETVDQLYTQGVAPSDTALREALLPIVDQPIPDSTELPQSFNLVLREIDSYLASNPAVEAKAVEAEPDPAPEVAEVRRLLEGRAMVLIGGERREQSRRNLEQAFGLTALRWISPSPHESPDNFEPAVADPQVAVVVLAIRWSSHVFGNVKPICQAYSVPLVRLPAGYGVNRVAREILNQCSKEIEEG